MSKIIELSIFPEVTPDWGVWESLREFWQNYLDNKNGGNVSYDVESQTLTLTSKDTSLDRSLFVTGKSGKRDDPNSIGRHGDGVKTAITTLLVQGLEVLMYNDDLLWKPLIQYSSNLECDVVCIEEVVLDDAMDNTDFTVIVKGVSGEDYNRCVENVLQLQPFHDKFTTTWGDVLLSEEHKGKIFAGGLYVTSASNFQYGYNILPKHVKLDRDRKRLDNFDLQWTTKDMISQMSRNSVGCGNNIDNIVDSLYSKKQDTQYLTHSTVSKEVKDRCFEVFKEKHGEKVIADTTQEVDKLKASGYSSVTFLGNDGFTSLVKGSEGYQSLVGNVEVKKPSDILLEFESKYKDEMSIEMLDDYIEMQETLLKLI